MENDSNEPTFIGSPTLQQDVRTAISRLPSDVAEWSASSITFVCVDGISSLACINLWPAPDGKVNVIVLNEQTGKTEQERLFTIVREIAHVRLGHANSTSGDALRQQQEQADALANDWGFPRACAEMPARSAPR